MVGSAARFHSLPRSYFVFKNGVLKVKNFMKELIPEQIENMTLSEAWKIAREFGDFIANRDKPMLIDYEDVLPYSKSDILLALVKILKDEKPELLRKKTETKNKIELKECVAILIMKLEDFIPNEKKYKEMVKTREDILEEFSKEENIKFWNKTKKEFLR